MKSVELKDNSLLINGKPSILLSSSLFYFRIKPEFWKERMQQLKDCGYNAIDVYIPWNFHEISPDCWDFSGIRDIDGFLKLAAQEGLYVIVRPGPYICSEWDGGGLPAWLKADGRTLRQYDKQYLSEVEKWFDIIFPIIKNRECGNGGSVILMQLENELDIYHCLEPELYLEALREMAEKYDFDIPYVVCTSGQLDVDCSGGTATGVYPAFNVYSSEDSPALEEHIRMLTETLRETGIPLLTTETMRAHSFLKRELLCGVRLISPYCQTASHNYDFYNGISTWGNCAGQPVSYITDDYDHGAMIRADGRTRAQYFEGRCMGSLIHTLQEQLGGGVPFSDFSMKICGDLDRLKDNITAMNLAGGGQLLGIPNVGERKTGAIIAGESRIDIVVDTMETLLLPFQLPLMHWGCEQAKIEWSSLEIYTIEQISSKVLRIIVYGKGSGICLNISGQCHIVPPETEKSFEFRDGFIIEVIAVRKNELSAVATKDIPAFAGKMETDGETIKVTAGIDEPFRYPEPMEIGPIQSMEEKGVYTGTGIYDFETSENAKELLLDGATDMVKIYNNDRVQKVFFGKGEMHAFSICPGRVRIYTEIWGHNCGHGIGWPVILLGCKKGIRGAYEVCERIDLQYNWKYSVMPESRTAVLRTSMRKWPGIIDFGDRTPLKLDEMYVYSKELLLPDKGEHRYLHIRDGKVPVRVYLNGCLIGEIREENPYLEITDAAQPGQKVRLTLCYSAPGMNPTLGHVYLVAANEIKKCRFGAYTRENVKKTVKSVGKEIAFPMILHNGETRKVTLKLPPHTSEQKVWMSIDGWNIKTTILYESTIIGRLFSNCDMGGINICSGDSNRVWIPETGENPNDFVILLVEAMEEQASLEAVKVILD